ncbi:uncharacterized protein LOC116048438 isoform X2 [Sander lucioperca]|uniref:uncharacterized protein LOC116048438 isoform X2 n=1 Tax=Sander lucioperca TaxID=283035 RepID=UPI00125E2CDD|nr:uncharacterized protein LOC116048438 isoform X2 [Sander lucioperca]
MRPFSFSEEEQHRYKAEDMDHEVQTDASSQAHFQLEEGLVEEREASPWVALDKEVDFMPKDVMKDTYRKEATLVQGSVVQNMDSEVQFGASCQAHLQLEEGLLEEREASLEITSSEELDMGIMEESKTSAQVFLDEEVDTLPKDVTEDTYRKEETLVQDSAVQDMDHEVYFGASSQTHFQLEEGLLEKREATLKLFSSEELEEALVEEREASPRGSLEQMVTMVSLADGDTSSVTLETNVAVHLEDELEVAYCSRRKWRNMRHRTSWFRTVMIRRECVPFSVVSRR